MGFKVVSGTKKTVQAAIPKTFRSKKNAKAAAKAKRLLTGRKFKVIKI